MIRVLVLLLPMVISLNTQNFKLYEWPMILAHDAGSGYLPDSSALAKTQKGGFYDQLSCGARALDIRPRLNKQGELVMRHSTVEINYPLAKALEEVINFANHNTEDKDIVLLSMNHFDNENGDTYSATMKLLDQMGIYTIKYGMCSSTVSTMTLEMALEKSKIQGGGYIMASAECIKSNFDPDITCTYSPFNSNYCTDNSYTMFWDYLSKISNTPPNGYSLVQTQAIWQYGISSFDLSGPINQENKSNLNQKISQRVMEMPYVNLLELNNLAHNGYMVYQQVMDRIKMMDQMKLSP